MMALYDLTGPSAGPLAQIPYSILFLYLKLWIEEDRTATYALSKDRKKKKESGAKLTYRSAN